MMMIVMQWMMLWRKVKCRSICLWWLMLSGELAILSTWIPRVCIFITWSYLCPMEFHSYRSYSSQVSSYYLDSSHLSSPITTRTHLPTSSFIATAVIPPKQVSSPNRPKASLTAKDWDWMLMDVVWMLIDNSLSIVNQEIQVYSVDCRLSIIDSRLSKF